MVTRDVVPFDEVVFQLWRDLSANVRCVGTAWMEPAGLGWVDWARYFAWQNYSMGLVFHIWDWDS